jgi:hypothetical protein
MLSGEATNTNFKVFGLTRPGLEPTIYRTRGKHGNHYATDAIDTIDALIYLIKGKKGGDAMQEFCNSVVKLKFVFINICICLIV